MAYSNKVIEMICNNDEFLYAGCSGYNEVIKLDTSNGNVLNRVRFHTETTSIGERPKTISASSDCSKLCISGGGDYFYITDGDLNKLE